jgi:hypothetical protein
MRHLDVEIALMDFVWKSQHGTLIANVDGQLVGV